MGEEAAAARLFVDACAAEAEKATCRRSRCGSVIVKDNVIIGKGHNSPPGGLASQRRCDHKKSSYDQKVTDKTCCVHAEQRAIMDALRNDPDALPGSRLYFLRIGEADKPLVAGRPYCTICSKMALDTGVEEFVLVHEEGITVYSAEEYNNLSYAYKKS